LTPDGTHASRLPLLTTAESRCGKRPCYAHAESELDMDDHQKTATLHFADNDFFIGVTLQATLR
jgi:hypothetical protein